MKKILLLVAFVLLTLSILAQTVFACHCGDGFVSTPNDQGFNEACDDGSLNGIPCTATCDNECTYCSNECTLITIIGENCQGIDDECKDAGFDYGIAKWEWEDLWSPEGDSAGTLVEGDDQTATYSSGLDEGTEVAAAIVVKASTERDVILGGSGTVEAGEHALSHITFCGYITECGNGIVEGNEECDDGNTNDLDLCSNSCETQYCEFRFEKTDNPDPVKPGETLYYYIELENIGTAYCTGGGVQIKEYYDEMTSYVTANPLPRTSNYWWNFGEVPPGELNTIDIEMLVSQDAECDSTLVNKACVWSNELVTWHCIEEETEVVCDPFCGDGTLDEGEECDDGNTNDGDGCSSTCNIEPLIIKAHKVVCKEEQYLPNWGLSGLQDGEPGTVTSMTAADYVAANDDYCWIEEDWHFQWGYSSVPKLAGNYIGGAPTGTAYNEWKNFDSPTTSSSPAKVEIYDLQDTPRIWIRENLQEGYIPFANPPGDLQDPISAEMYCGNDVLNFDNYDWLNNLNLGQTRYCVAFNALDNYCGDGTINSGEECDDGNNNGQVCEPGYMGTCTYCSDTCENETRTGPYCGDGIWQSAYEACEGLEGNIPEHYVCNEQCETEYVPYCGDGIVNQASEECDGLAGVGPHQECSEQCTIIDLNYCGDGIKQTPNDDGFNEECDGNDGVLDNYQCLADCTLEYIPYCGDGTINSGEECDDGNNNGQVCTPDYMGTCTYCSDTCENETRTGPYCGDGIWQSAYEACEGLEGNIPEHYICTDQCETEYVPYCGDGIVNQASEECDGTPDCKADCTLKNYCGDGFIQTPNDYGLVEECDDNGQNGVVCEPDYMGSCTYCDTTCQNVTIPGPYCGDGIWQEGHEECEGTFGVLEGFICNEFCELEEIPNCINISYTNPYYTNETSQWIDTASRVELIVNTQISACVLGDHYYRYQEVDDAYCLGACGTWTPGDETWTSYTEVFPLPTESCYVIEDYSTTSLGQSDIQWDCVFVDKTPPIINKTVGIPSGAMPLKQQELGSNFYPELNPEGENYCGTEDACYQVSMDTKIHLSCEDVGDYSSGVAKMCYTIGLDGDDATTNYCDGTMENNMCCVDPKGYDLYFKEESWHELNITCTDNVNKTSNDREFFKVTGVGFEIQLNYKWNLISTPIDLFDNRMSSIFDEHNKTIVSVWTQDENGKWYSYTPDGIDNDNLEFMLPGWGYWVFTNLTPDEQYFIVLGGRLFNFDFYFDSGFEYPSKNVRSGTNIIGYYDGVELAPIGPNGLPGYYGPAGNGNTVEEEMCSLKPTYDSRGISAIWSYWSGDSFEQLGPLDRMDPGAGYIITVYNETSSNNYSPSTMCYNS